MGSRNDRKINIPMCLAFILFCLTLISTHMTSGLFARYTATSTGSDSARVAKFDVVGTVKAVEGTEGAFTLTVTSNSEVAVKYSISVEFNAPMSVKMAEKGETVYSDGVTTNSSDGKTTVTFTDADWIFAPGPASREHTLQFAVTDWTDITKDATGPTEISDPIGFTVNIAAEQID